MGVEIIINPLSVPYDMAKSLGQIHSVNTRFDVTTAGQTFYVDLPGQLTNQLQTMVRQGTYHKVVGIDMSVSALTPVNSGGGQITGSIIYYAPTQGRCAAYRSAFKSMQEQMRIQGLKMSDNRLYDFRVKLNDSTTSNPTALPNLATLDGTTGLALKHDSVPGASVFGIHNSNQQPIYTGTAGEAFRPGFNTLINTTAGTDFVLNDEVPFTGTAQTASLNYERIPFSLSFTPGSTDLTLDMEWRPDPALFIAVMCGQMQVVVETVEFDSGTGGATTALELNCNFMVSGWKSIMGDPSKKKRRTRKQVMASNLQSFGKKGSK